MYSKNEHKRANHDPDKNFLFKPVPCDRYCVLNEDNIKAVKTLKLPAQYGLTLKGRLFSRGLTQIAVLRKQWALRNLHKRFDLIK